MIQFSVRRPVAVIMICIGLVVLGIIAARRIPVQLMPNIQTPEFTILVTFKGATPEEVETMVTAPIERAISTVSGLYRMVSSSQRERSEIRVSFKSTINYLETISSLRDHLDSAGLPEGASRPKILRFQANAAPVIRLAVKPHGSGLSQLELARVLREILIHRLEAVDGVALTSLLGAPDKKVEIVIDPIAVDSYGLQLTSLPESIQSQNKSFPAGEVDFAGRQTSVKLGQSLQTLEDVRGLIVKQENGKAIRLGDIATVRETIDKPSVRTHLNGQDSLVIEVQKEAEANSVQVANHAKEVIEEFLKENSDKLHGQILFDQGKQIEIAIDNVGESVFHGGILAGLVIFVLLQNWWPTFVVSLSMPISILITFILMYFTGITFNLMSLAGLALGVGMLVDNSTIVLDNIHLYQQKTDDPKMAAYLGTKTVFGAITGSTIATMAVFAPLAFVEGMIGQMFRDVAATVCYALAASLFSAVFLIPMLSSIQGGSVKLGESSEPLVNRFSIHHAIEILRPRFLQLAGSPIHRLQALMNRYLAVLKLSFSLSGQVASDTFTGLWPLIKKIIDRTSAFFSAIGKPGLDAISTQVYRLEILLKTKIPQVIHDSRKTLVLAIGLTLAGVVFLMWRGAELFPDEAADQIVYTLEFAPGQTLDLTESRVVEVEHAFEGIDGIESVSSVTGQESSNQSRLTFQVNEKQSVQLEKIISARLSHQAGLVFNRVKDAMVGEGKPIQIDVYNENLAQLKDQASEVKSLVAGVEGVSDVESNIKPDISEVDIQFSKNRLSWFGADAGAFISTLKAMLMGQSAGQLQIKGETLPLNVMIPRDYFNSIEKIRDLSVAHDENKKIFLSQVSEVDEHKILGSIKRINRKRVATISANLAGSDLETVSKHIRSALKEGLKGDKPVDWRTGGQDEERERSQKSLIVAVGMSIFLIYLMLAAQFGNLVQPVIVLCAVPLCISGVAVFLLLFNLNVSALVFVGFIILVGVSVNTSIVMVDFANQMVTEGQDVKDAIAEAAVRRMRPILVTTLSGILGLVPMALAIGQGSGMQQPLAVTMIGGHLSSTVLTMLVVPIIYARLARPGKNAVEE